MLRLVRFERSTNVERVALALAYKGIEVESVWVDPGDRSPVVELSGQDLVPVLVDGERVIPDSTAILEHLEAVHPDPPLYPADPARRAEVCVFIDWFNRVWKGPPNRIADALDAGRADPGAVARAGARLQARLGLFEDLLAGREYLFGAFGVADCVAWPFLRYAAHLDPEDPWTFHRVLHEHMDLGAGHPRLGAWIERMAARPLA
jgi:glutathione S-transferase